MTDNNLKNYYLFFLCIVTIAFNTLFITTAMAEDENEETYTISLVQTAEVAKEIVTLEDKKVLTESYTAKKGDHIWKILRKKNLLKKNNLGEILSVLKKLNHSLSNLDRIHPGEKIIIPLIITPIMGNENPGRLSTPETASLEEIKNLDHYTVMPGDSIIKVITNKYSIPENVLYNEYLEQLKKLNPDLKNLDNIYPGQKVRLPIYSPKIARGPVEEEQKESKESENNLKLKNREKGKHLGKIFNLIGEEWIDQGKHFIPLKTGGQFDLNTETYPIINLRNGNRVIVDLFNNLPEKMAALIRSNWDNYSIVHITEDDDIKSALDKTLIACNYERIYPRNEGLIFEKEIKVELTADWIIKLFTEPSNISENIIYLNVTEEMSKTPPTSIRDFLKSHGIKIINYPPDTQNTREVITKSNAVSMVENRKNTVEKIFKLIGQKYSTRVDIPIFRGEDSDFNLVVKADYFYTKDGKECIIDLNGLGSDIIDLLKENRFLVLPLPDEPELFEILVKTLEFLDMDTANKEHIFYTIPGKRQNNIKLVIPGILFNDINGQSNFFSSSKLHPDIFKFLSIKIDNIFYFDSPLEAEENGS